MRVFLSIKYHPDMRNRALIEAISAALRVGGMDTICVVRDLEAWGTVAYTPQALMEATFAAIHQCALVLVELSEKGVGVGIEAGYAYARQKPIVVLAPTGADLSSTLAGIATLVVRYNSHDDLAAILAQIMEEAQLIGNTADSD